MVCVCVSKHQMQRIKMKIKTINNHVDLGTYEYLFTYCVNKPKIKQQNNAHHRWGPNARGKLTVDHLLPKQKLNRLEKTKTCDGNNLVQQLCNLHHRKKIKQKQTFTEPMMHAKPANQTGTRRPF